MMLTVLGAVPSVSSGPLNAEVITEQLQKVDVELCNSYMHFYESNSSHVLQTFVWHVFNYRILLL